MIIRLKVFEQTLSIIDTKSVPRKGSKDYLVLHFLFSSDWKDLNKVCYLQRGEVSQPIDVADGLVEVPEWFTQQDSFDVTLFGTSGSKEVPTNVVSLRLEKSNTLWEQDAPEPQPSWLAAEVYYIDLAGNYPDYTCPVAMADIKAAYEAGNVLTCRCAMGPYTATLPLFIPMPSASTWIFSGSGALAAMNFTAQSLTIAIVNGAVQASNTRLATKSDIPFIPSAMPNPNALTITSGSNSVTYDGSTPENIDIPTALPNPNALTFTGAVTGTYNGSNPVSIEIPSGVQSDWNQNDDTQPDYVKNRPFYTKTVEAVIVEEVTLAFEGGSSNLESTFEATVGETYKVYWDGATYECICVDFRGMSAIGNLSIMGAGSDTGEPFFAVVSNGVGIDMVASDTAASHTISISGLSVEVVKIDEKYLPTIPADKLPTIPADKLPTIPVIEFTTSISENIANATQPSFFVSNLSYSEIYSIVEKGSFHIKDPDGVLRSPIEHSINSSGTIFIDIIVVGSSITYAQLACNADQTRFYRNNWWQIEATKK